jgi:hypothetical protein
VHGKHRRAVKRMDTELRRLRPEETGNDTPNDNKAISQQKAS